MEYTTTAPQFDLTTAQGIADFTEYARQFMAENGREYMIDVYYFTSGDREVTDQAGDLIGYMQEMETGNEDFWVLEPGELYTCLTNDAAKQWEVLEQAARIYFALHPFINAYTN